MILAAHLLIVLPTRNSLFCVLFIDGRVSSALLYGRQRGQATVSDSGRADWSLPHRYLILE